MPTNSCSIEDVYHNFLGIFFTLEVRFLSVSEITDDSDVAFKMIAVA